MKFNYVPHAISKDNDQEAIRLTLSKSYDMDARITIEWTRSSKTEWAHSHLVNGHMVEASAIGSLMQSVARFCEEEKVDIDDPAAFITANEKSGGEMYVRNASGTLIRVSDLAKNAENDEYITSVNGMKKRYQCFASDEDDAQTIIGKLMLSKAKEDVTVYDDMSAWGKGGHTLRKVEKNDAVKMPDLNLYCKRGQSRPSVGMRLKAGK